MTPTSGTVQVYGIPNCDRVRAALRYLKAAGIDAPLHDVRADGLPDALARRMIATIGLDSLVNRRSAAWRALDCETREAAMDPARAASVLAARPLLLARPVLTRADGAMWQGFSRQTAETMLAWARSGR